MPSFGTLKADTLTHSTAGSVDTTYVANGTLKAWGGFDTYTPGLGGDTLNMSSFTDNGSGDGTHTFTNAFAAAGGYMAAGYTGGSAFMTSYWGRTTAIATVFPTGSVRNRLMEHDGDVTDTYNGTMMYVGDLA